MAAGYVKVYRAIAEHTVWNDPPAFRVFMHLLLTANHKPGKMTYKNGPGVGVVDVNRGEAIFGAIGASKATGIPPTSAQRALDRLERLHGVITTKPGKHFTLVRITNYDTYQSSKPEDGLTSGKDRVEIGSTSGTSNNDKNDKNEKKKDSAPAFPPALDTEPFRAAWGTWTQHRREIRKALTPLSITRQLKQLAPLGPEQAVACIELSIGNGWTGLFPERFGGAPEAAVDIRAILGTGRNPTQEELELIGD